MHIDPTLVTGTKLLLGYATCAASFSILGKFMFDAIRDRGYFSLFTRSSLAALLVLVFFEVLPHTPIGVSEVHLILGSTLLLMLGTAAAGLGLATGLLIQGLFFAPFDLPQYGMNVTTLLAPLFAMHVIARRIIAPGTAYVNLSYRQAFRLSATYQAGIVGWVAFWAFYGQGFGTENLISIAAFGAAYLTVIIIEPLADLAILAMAKRVSALRDARWLEHRLYHTV